jgi:surfeit locus 1 family protein
MINSPRHWRSGFFFLCLFFVVLFCWLGVWQLHRYHYKRDLLNTYQQRLSTAPVALKQITEIKDSQFQRVVTAGEYLNQHTMLVQNRFYHGQLGYEVLTPLQIAGEKSLLLVDRGWIQKPMQANTLPTLEKVRGQQRAQGYIKLLNEHVFILGKNILDSHASTVVMQKIDLAEIGRITGQTFYPFILRLDADQAHGYVRDWVITAMIPERHMAYAVQWFALALIVMIAYVCTLLPRRES